MKSTSNELQKDWVGLSKPTLLNGNSHNCKHKQLKISTDHVDVFDNLGECFEDNLYSIQNQYEFDDLQQCPPHLSEKLNDSCKSCSTHLFCQDYFQQEENCDIEDINNNVNFIKHKLFILSPKDGVGKTTFACNMAILLARDGYKVGLLDIDVTGSSIKDLISTEERGIYTTTWVWKPLVCSHLDIKVTTVGQYNDPNKMPPISSTSSPTHKSSSFIRRVLKEIKWGKLDFLICDFPSGTNEENLQAMRILRQLKPDGSIIVGNPHKISQNSLRASVKFCQKTNIKIIGLVENMHLCVCQQDAQCNKHVKTSSCKQIAAEFGERYLGAMQINVKLALESGNALNFLCAQFKECEFSTFYDNINDIVEKIKCILFMNSSQ